MKKLILIISLITVLGAVSLFIYFYNDKIVIVDDYYEKFDGEETWGDSTFCSIKYTPEDSMFYYRFSIKYHNGGMYKSMVDKGEKLILQFLDEHGFSIFEDRLPLNSFILMLDKGVNPGKRDSLKNSKHYTVMVEKKMKMLPEKFFRIESHGVGGQGAK